MAFIRTVLLSLAALAIAFAGGAWSAKAMLDHFSGSDILRVGPWQADRMAGSPNADPYSRASYARQGSLAPGLGEGVSFRAALDSSGQALHTNCTYRLSGRVPAARLYSLAAFSVDGQMLVAQPSNLPAYLLSSGLARNDANEAPIIVSATAQPGNWLALAGNRPYVLALTLYDTPVTTSTGAAVPVMPSIERLGCKPNG
ncbi:DUF1214 domain-containing protein [Aureimonas fodinaquatilis]|uniref:DUF1214 domain-containing protein n=1 Tax=Aureimonas fodinaquatilis TaxID=2565783 RepID=A0A5B0E0U7_9HYPH|nr:DUF1214 domain-containing protein [Aureimonas fodinaquatilis]KAA0971089.1 DUF1214 domain-containing protein [Aureimonas fodinaquatilis]